MAIKNRTCLACGTKYSFCPDCNGADKIAPTWKSDFCSETCMTLWTTCTKFNLNKLTKPEAKSIISALTLKPIDQYVKCVQRDLGVILKEEPKPKSKRAKRSELPVIDEAIPEEQKVEVIDENIHEVIKTEEE